MATGIFSSTNPALESPSETLDIEFKRTLDLKDNLGKAKLAKEICALANHGGGSIVLGRNDNGSYPDNLPKELANVNQDTINQISSAYLDPAPHCTVQWEQPEGVAYKVPVISVPSVEKVPIYAKKNGPDDGKGKIEGINKGTCYIRATKPESRAIKPPYEWADIIKLCAPYYLSPLPSESVTRATSPQPTKEKSTVFGADFQHTIRRWQGSVTAYSPHQDVDLAGNFVAYIFHLPDAKRVEINDLRDCLQKEPGERYTRRFFTIDRLKTTEEQEVKSIEVDGIDGLQVHTPELEFDHRSVWCVNENLSGIEINSYWEDSEHLQKALEGNWKKGAYIWIDLHIQCANDFLARVKQIADHFSYTGQVKIGVRFTGLNGQILQAPLLFENPWNLYHNDTYRFYQDERTFETCFDDISVLKQETRSAATAAIIERLNKIAGDSPEVTPEYVVEVLQKRR